MAFVNYSADRIREFCQREDIQKLINSIKEKWNGVVVYTTPSNIMELKVFHEEANISDIFDLVKVVHPEYTMDGFYKGRYGYFVEITTYEPEEDDLIL